MLAWVALCTPKKSGNSSDQACRLTSCSIRHAGLARLVHTPSLARLVHTPSNQACRLAHTCPALPSRFLPPSLHIGCPPSSPHRIGRSPTPRPKRPHRLEQRRPHQLGEGACGRGAYPSTGGRRADIGGRER
eukprot:scaffold138481_cov13-Tisochrysis_lutea.AAC.1